MLSDEQITDAAHFVGLRTSLVRLDRELRRLPPRAALLRLAQADARMRLLFRLIEQREFYLADEWMRDRKQWRQWRNRWIRDLSGEGNA